MKAMKKMLAMLLILPMVFGVSVHAETKVEEQPDFSCNYVTDGWWVEFKGNKMTQNFTQDDIDYVTGQLQPGDSWVVKIELRNNIGNQDWYLSNKVIQTYEENEDGTAFINGGNGENLGITKADNGAYSYTLTYQKAGQERTLYDSKNIGGDDQNGLHGAAQTLSDYIYVDSTTKGENGLVTLVITCDGETLNNDYQNSRAVISMKFAMQAEDEHVDTGDTTNIALYGGLAAASLVGLGVVFFLLKKNKKNENDENNEGAE